MESEVTVKKTETFLYDGNILKYTLENLDKMRKELTELLKHLKDRDTAIKKAELKKDEEEIKSANKMYEVTLQKYNFVRDTIANGNWKYIEEEEDKEDVKTYHRKAEAFADMFSRENDQQDYQDVDISQLNSISQKGAYGKSFGIPLILFQRYRIFVQQASLSSIFAPSLPHSTLGSYSWVLNVEKHAGVMYAKTIRSDISSACTILSVILDCKPYSGSGLYQFSYGQGSRVRNVMNLTRKWIRAAIKVSLPTISTYSRNGT
jgi:hypothetical protein